jgi:hypothetical protein
MPRFHFDIRNGPHFIPDEEGLELSDLDAAKLEAANSLADLARDTKPDGHDTAITIEVRQDDDIVFCAGLNFTLGRRPN